MPHSTTIMAGVPHPPAVPPTLEKSRPHVISSVEGEKTCLINLDLFFEKSITPLKHVPQTGPNCGLAALAMVINITPKPYSVDDIFNEAKSKGYTNNGEMFSVHNMAVLAQNYLNPWFDIEVCCDGLANNTFSVMEYLYDGSLMLIPYDADKNHSPCCLKGHKAHWALVCGVMKSAEDEVFVAARQGKSRYLAVWPLDALAQSNANLCELCPMRASDGNLYVLPDGGLSDGLANKFILLHRNC